MIIQKENATTAAAATGYYFFLFKKSDLTSYTSDVGEFLAGSSLYQKAMKVSQVCWWMTPKNYDNTLEARIFSFSIPCNPT